MPIEKKETPKETPHKIMESETTKNPVVPAIKSGKIESDLKFSPTKESKPQVQTRVEKNTPHSNIGWHTHHESQP